MMESGCSCRRLGQRQRKHLEGQKKKAFGLAWRLPKAIQIVTF
nr:MAG TPA: hypothetical protein [Caudoviricetes sp.]